MPSETNGVFSQNFRLQIFENYNICFKNSFFYLLVYENNIPVRYDSRKRDETPEAGWFVIES